MGKGCRLSRHTAGGHASGWQAGEHPHGARLRDKRRARLRGRRGDAPKAPGFPLSGLEVARRRRWRAARKTAAAAEERKSAWDPVVAEAGEFFILAWA